MSSKLTAYVEAAMRHAKFEHSIEDGTYRGEAPGFFGAFASATTLEACREELRRVLQEWILFRASRNLSLPTVDGVSLSGDEVINTVVVHDRLQKLESELQALKADVAFPSDTSASRNPLVKYFNLALKNWGFVTFVVGLIIASWVYIHYDVGYLENFKNISDTKKSSDFYLQLGDLMMSRSQYKAADDAYNAALKINANNINATRGLLINQVFQPVAGQKKLTPEMVEVKLKYLENLFKTDHRITFFRGINFRDQKNHTEAIASFKKCLTENPDFHPCRLELGYSYMWAEYNIEQAIANFREVVNKDKNNALAQHNLGNCYLVLGDFDRAEESLVAASKLSDRLLTVLNLGDVYIYKGNSDYAIFYYEYALDKLKQPDIAEQNFIPKEATHNYMPETRDDRLSSKKFIKASTLNQDKMLTHFGLSIAYALTSDRVADANNQFKEGLKLAGGDQNLKNFFANKITSVLNLSQPPIEGEKRAWFEARLKELKPKDKTK